LDLYLAGFALGFGLISKYTAVAILPAIFVIFILDPALRSDIFKRQPYIALFLTLIVFTPVLVWNFNHDWGSMKFQFADRSREMKSIQTKYVFQLIASQLFLLTPMVLILFFRTTKRIFAKWRQNTVERYFFITGIFIISGFTVLSLTTLIKMNWLLPGYMGIILATTLLFYRDDLLNSRWIKSGIISSVILIIIAYAILLIPNIPLGDGNTWSGWKETAVHVADIQKEKGGKDNVFVFANSYKTASLLKFYLPEEQEVYAQNIYGQPALQFDIWGLPPSLKDKDALFIITDRGEYKSDLKLVEKYFDGIDLILEKDFMFNSKQKARTIYCYYAKNYRGVEGN